MEITVTEAAALLGRSPRTVRAQVARGELPGVKRGGQWFVKKSALPLTEAQRDALQRKADRLRDSLEEALPARLARSAGQRRRGLLDLDAFRLGAELLDQIVDAPPEATPEADRAALVTDLRAALLAIAEASAHLDREARRAALLVARSALGRINGQLLLLGRPPRAPVSDWLDALEGAVLPAVIGFARWSERPSRRAP